MAWPVASRGRTDVRGSVAGGYSAEAQQYFNRLTDPGTLRKDLLAALIDSWVASGCWALIDCAYMFASDIAGNALVNMKSSSFAASAGTSPTFAAGLGYTGNGTTQQVTTAFNPTTAGGNWVQNGASAWSWCRTVGLVQLGVCGNVTAPRLNLIPRGTGDVVTGRINDDQIDTRASTDGSGLFGVQRTGATVKQLWRNGAKLGADFSTASTGLPNQNLYPYGTNSTGFPTQQVAFTAFCGSLAGKESSFYTPLATYIAAFHSSGLILVPIDLTTVVTRFGDMSIGGGLVSSFEGTTNQSTAVSSQKASVDNTGNAYIGRPLDTPARIGQFRIFGANNNGYLGTDNPTITAKFYGKTGATPANSTDGTEIAELIFTDTADESAGRTVAVTNATVWDHIWVRFSHNNGTARTAICTELQAWTLQ